MTQYATVLRQAAADYLTSRRALGYKLERAEKLLDQFLTYLEEQDAATVTVEDAVAWVTLPEPASPSWLGFRMSVVRGFATYLHTIDPTAEVPPTGLVPSGGRRAVPYLYSDDDIAALVEACSRILRYRLRVATHQTLIRLLAASGMRIGEAIGLDDDDFDATRGLIIVHEGKFGKARQIPIHTSTVAALRAYQQLRDALYPRPHAPAMFISTAGTRLLYYNVSQTFVRLVHRADLQPRPGASRPRLHDFRHSFAVHTLLDWYRDGRDIPARLPLLSTYLGHTNPAHTYWYLQAAPELLTLAGQRLDAHLESHS